jgi:hypothetical protein
MAQYVCHIQFSLVGVAVSYLTLAVFAPKQAASLWWEYAIVIALLAVLNLVADRKKVKNGTASRFRHAGSHR